MTATPQDPPAVRLRQAATVLHEAVAAVSRDVLRSWPGPGDVPTRYAACVQDSLGGTGGAFAALMHPGVATAIALLLEAEALRVTATAHPDWQEDVAPHALTVADTILAAPGRPLSARLSAELPPRGLPEPQPKTRQRGVQPIRSTDNPTGETK